MTVLQGVLAGAGLVAVLMGLMWRMFVHFDAKNESRIDLLDTKNERAHAAITENIKAVDDRAERRSEAHQAALEAQRTALEAMNERVRALTANVQAVDDRAERRAGAHQAALEAQRTALEAMNERMHALTANVRAVDDRAERRSEAHQATL